MNGRKVKKGDDALRFLRTPDLASLSFRNRPRVKHPQHFCRENQNEKRMCVGVAHQTADLAQPTNENEWEPQDQSQSQQDDDDEDSDSEVLMF